MKVLIVIVSVLLVVTTAILPQKGNDERISQAVANFLNPDTLHKVLTVIGESSGDKLCPICQKMVSTLDSFLGDATVQSKLSGALALVCDKITDQNKQQTCNKLVTKEFPMILNVVKSMINPNTMCVKLFKVCSAPSVPIIGLKSSYPDITAVINDLTCAACYTGFGFIDQAFFNDDFSTFCYQELQPLICGGISDPEKKQKCLDTVQKFTGEIFKILLKYVNPEFLCMGRIPDINCPTSTFEKLKSMKF